MSYNFSFDKKTIAFLLGGFAFVGIMLFIAGLLIGNNWRTEQPAVAAAVAATTTTGGQPVAASPAPAPAPMEPVLKAPAKEADAPGEMAAPDPASSSAKQAHSIAGLKRGEAAAPPKLYNNSDGEALVLERANPSATKADDFVRMNESSFSIQVGVFLDEKDANQLVSQLQSKGYTPFVLATNDDESRMWYAVRVGTYTDRTEAARAASNIATQEKIKTYVRPTGSL